METAAALFDIVAMLGLFVIAFLLWVAWELITKRKGAALLLAAVTFIATWLVAGVVGATAAWHYLVVEALVALIVFRVANRGREEPET